MFDMVLLRLWAGISGAKLNLETYQPRSLGLFFFVCVYDDLPLDIKMLRIGS